MAADSEEIYPATELREELRLSTPTLDSLLIRKLQEAISEVTAITGWPLIDRQQHIEAAIENEVVTIERVGIKSISSFKYWTTAAKAHQAPDGTIEEASLLLSLVQDRHYEIRHRDSDGWPADMRERNVRIELAVGVAADQVPAALRNAITLIARDSFDGIARDTTRRAVADITRRFQW